VKQYKVQIASLPDFSRVVETVTTDNPSYAPTMTQYGYNGGGTLYWRVAGVDEDRNQGDWTQVQQIKLQPRLKVRVYGTARRKRLSLITVRVSDATNRRLAGALVRVTGAGLKPVSRRTNKLGQIVFKVKPRKTGKLLFSASRKGFQPAYGSLKVK
jgi:hypothetical protein